MNSLPKFLGRCHGRNRLISAATDSALRHYPTQLPHPHRLCLGSGRVNSPDLMLCLNEYFSRPFVSGAHFVDSLRFQMDSSHSVGRSMNCEAGSPLRGAKHAYFHLFQPRLTFLRHYVELETCVCKKFGHDSDE